METTKSYNFSFNFSPKFHPVKNSPGVWNLMVIFSFNKLFLRFSRNLPPRGRALSKTHPGADASVLDWWGTPGNIHFLVVWRSFFSWIKGSSNQAQPWSILPLINPLAQISLWLQTSWAQQGTAQTLKFPWLTTSQTNPKAMVSLRWGGGIKHNFMEIFIFTLFLFIFVQNSLSQREFLASSLAVPCPPNPAWPLVCTGVVALVPTLSEKPNHSF